MPITRKRRGLFKPNVYHLSDLNYDSTCISLELPYDIACEVCKPKSNFSLLKKSSRPSQKRLKYLHYTNRCKQYWDSHWVKPSNVTNGILLNHVQSRRYLGVAPDVAIEYYCVYDKTDKGHKDTLGLIDTTQYSQSTVARARNTDHHHQEKRWVSWGAKISEHQTCERIILY